MSVFASNYNVPGDPYEWDAQKCDPAGVGRDQRCVCLSVRPRWGRWWGLENRLLSLHPDASLPLRSGSRTSMRPGGLSRFNRDAKRCWDVTPPGSGQGQVVFYGEHRRTYLCEDRAVVRDTF